MALAGRGLLSGSTWAVTVRSVCWHLSTDLFWTEWIPTAAEVRTDVRESHDVSLHAELLAALMEHLLEHPGVETSGKQRCHAEVMHCLTLR